MQTSNRQKRVYTVGQVNEYAKSLLTGDPLLRDICVRGEISNLKHHSSGHVYFSIKDSEALLRCAFFRQDAMRCKAQLRDGLQVVARGYITIYARDGSYQMVVSELETAGAGALYQLFERLKAQLAGEGLFDPARKRPIPFFVQKIAVVTSPTGAVIRDIERVARARYPGIEITLFPVPVQGEGAEGLIARAITQAGQSDADVVIAGRGGGSMEDLWAFNEEIVARAICACAKPVVSAVGHETDFTIADFAADARASTPSNAAEMCAPDAFALMNTVSVLRTRAARALKMGIDARRERLARLMDRPVMSDPGAFIDVVRQKGAALQARADAAMARGIELRRHGLALSIQKAAALSPKHVLERGYALVTRDGRAVGDANALKSGDEIAITFSNGEKRAVIKE